jgi:hypothetical protein
MWAFDVMERPVSDDSKVVRRVTRRVVRRQRAVSDGDHSPCSFCGGSSRPGVQGDHATICATCVRDAFGMLSSLDEDD